ncbi:MAG TPA: META domain-containing protein [Ilumatobacter sp.]|nr:META domain-containing protein [Ilumatobacter sp.]
MRALIAPALLGLFAVASACGEDSPSGGNGTTAAPGTIAAVPGAITTVSEGPSASAPGAVTTASVGATAPSGELAVAIESREFVSSHVEGYELVEGSQIRLTFGDWLAASGGCNYLDFTWSLDGDRLVIPEWGTTDMACEPAALMDQDDWLLSFLTTGPTVALEGDTLTLTGDDAVITLLDDEVVDADRPLDGTTWALTDLINAPATAPAAGTEAPMINFAAAEVDIDTGCNTGRATYDADAGTLTIASIRLTRTACTDQDTTAREAAVLAVLEGTSTYEIEGDELTITNGDTGLIYRAMDRED